MRRAILWVRLTLCAIPCANRCSSPFAGHQAGPHNVLVASEPRQFGPDLNPASEELKGNGSRHSVGPVDRSKLR